MFIRNFKKLIRLCLFNRLWRDKGGNMLTVEERIFTAAIISFFAGMLVYSFLTVFINKFLRERKERLQNKIKELKIHEPVIL
jgi:hypothetical protein